MVYALHWFAVLWLHPLYLNYTCQTLSYYPVHFGIIVRTWLCYVQWTTAKAFLATFPVDVVKYVFDKQIRSWASRNSGWHPPEYLLWFDTIKITNTITFCWQFQGGKQFDSDWTEASPNCYHTHLNCFAPAARFYSNESQRPKKIPGLNSPTFASSDCTSLLFSGFFFLSVKRLMIVKECFVKWDVAFRFFTQIGAVTGTNQGKNISAGEWNNGLGLPL